jgi:lysophospholipase L1-like esterase
MMPARTRSSKTFLALSLWVALHVPLTAQTATRTNQSPEVRWAKEIGAFLASDRTHPPPQNAVLFVGSSSVRLWTNLAQSFPQHRIINRGFGGSQLSDSVVFADRIVIPYKPKLILLYAGDNDIAGGKSPEKVCDGFKAFAAKVHAALPATPIGYIAIKACPAREKFLASVMTANGLIRDYCKTDKRLLFVDVFTPMLTPEGQPRADLVIKDGLHPNAKCYELWALILRPVLDKYDPPGSGRSQSGSVQ